MVHVPRSIPSPAFRAASLSIHAADGFAIAARRFEPSVPARATVVLHGATAVPQRFYRRFAEHFARHGYRVITYDYRGIGDSRPASLRGFDARMSDWARLDAAAVLDHVSAAHAGPRVAIGHSFGGQLIGILDRAADVDAEIMVASQLPTLRHWPLPTRTRLAAIWYGLVPVTTAVLGYMPGTAGLGVDLPAGVAREWGRWLRARTYLVDDVDGARERFARFRAPTLFYSFTDDALAPRAAVDAMLDQLRGAPLRHRRIPPADVGADRVGHLGLFRSAAAETLWAEIADQLDVVLERGRFTAGAPHHPPAPEATLWTITPQELRGDLDYGRD